MNCTTCNGPCFPLGILGTLAWFRCRDCGMESYTNVNSVEYDSYIEDEELEVA